MNKFNRLSIILFGTLGFITIFNEIFMLSWTNKFWNSITFTFYCGVNFILLAIFLQVGIAWYEQLYGVTETPITIKRLTKRVRSVI